MKSPIARSSRAFARTAILYSGRFALGLCVFASSVVVSARQRDPISPAEMQARVDELAHAPWSGKFKEKDARYDGYCHRSTLKVEVTDPQTGEKRDQKLYLYRPNSKNKVPLVVVVPTMDGITILEPEVASQFCSSKIAAIIADVNNPAQPPELPAWGTEDANNRRAILALRTVIDYARQDARFEPGQIGMMGLSLGGITTAMMAGLEPERLRAVAIAVGSGNLPYVMSESDNRKVSELRSRRMSHLGMNDVRAYEEVLHETIRYDPMHFTSLTNRDRILMIMARQDTKVPFSAQRDLYTALGGPDYMIFAGNHVGSLLSLTYLYMGTVIDFFKARFAGKYGVIAVNQ